jgi:hypothetical protein
MGLRRVVGMVLYEEALDRAPDQALKEGSMHFEEKSAVHATLRKLAARLDELGVPYAFAGAMALFAHGYRRFTEVVDVLVTPEGLKKIHENLAGLGYVPPFDGSRNLRDAETGVRIEFLVTGGFPGDGKPKPVAFPDPAQASSPVAGLRCLPLITLIELKLASGMTNPGRLKDLADVQETIRALHLPQAFAAQLNPYVRDRFLELWKAVEDSSRNAP